MKILTKSISTLLAVLMLLGSMTCLSVLNVSAADKTDETEVEKTAATIDYTTEVFKNPEEALQWMQLYMENENYEFWINEYTAVFALRNKKTGQITFSNPYDVASSQGSTSTKEQILSQIHIKYVDNGQTKDMYSYSDAVLNEQIKVKKIKSGVRVEYIIGNEATKKLVPRLISEKNFNELLVTPLEEAIGGTHNFNRFVSFYEKQDVSAATSEATRLSILKRFPKAADMVLYSLDAVATSVDINFLEELIKGYCPDYTFDQMEADHEETGYEGENELSPVFKLALEYTLNEDGLTVRQPTNGLRFNTTLYSVESVDVLAYFGAGNSYNDGYTFYPDGSGALFNFKDLAGKSIFTASRKIYGADYAYHTLDGTYQKALRMPVFGIQSDDAYYTFTTSAVVTDEDTGAEDIVETTHKISVTVVHTLEEMQAQVEADLSAGVYGDSAELVSEIEIVTESRGFLAVIEEGESLCQLATYHAGSLSDYHTVMNYFNPRPKDSYDLSDSISVSASSTMTVVSDRKYTGNLKIRYVLLSDDEMSEQTGFKDSGSYYRADYIGMANAYTAYLVAQGVLDRLTADDVTADIPLYIESFGALEVTEQIMSFPVDVMKPLTTFDDIELMYDELSKQGVKNINFRLTGFANGGMYSVVPTKLKWEKAVGGKSGMKDLLAYADDVNKNTDGNLGIYPDFDFLYINSTSLFDGVRLKRDVIRTIDNRYASKQVYSATRQKYMSYYVLALSPAYIDRFYNKLLSAYDAYADYSSLGISVATLGTDLSTDFDEDEPYNREDNKRFLKEAMNTIASNKNVAGVMSDGGNAYMLSYVDHLLNVSLDSSRFMKASRSIPFVGLVLHGYVQFAGTPINMEGDADYALLKAIENGASLYFILSYRNTNILKEDYFLSENYSVNYSIWKEDVIEYYNELNRALGDVQTKTIIDHAFIDGTRVLDVEEIEAALKATMEANDAYEQAFEETTMMEHIAKIAAARAAAKNAVATMEKTLEQLRTDAENMKTVNDTIMKKIASCDAAKATYDEKAADPRTTTIALKAYLRNYNMSLNDVRSAASQGIQVAVDALYAYETVVEMQKTATDAVDLLTEAGAAEELIEAARVGAESASEYLEDIKALAEECYAYVDGIYEAASTHVDRKTIDSYIDFHEDEEEDSDDGEDEVVVRNNGNIVAVTYGGKNGDDNAPYKTFILNYNNYAVTVKYDVDGQTKIYTIPANRYVMIQY